MILLETEDLCMLDLDAIISEASQLPVADRLQLIDRLAESIPDDQPPSLSEQWIAEIDRQSEKIKEAKDEGVEK